MCGRITLTTTDLAAWFGPFEGEPLPPRYNIAPTQPVATLRLVEGRRVLGPMRWGLIPHWAQDLKKLPMLINARADTVAEKPSFKHALRARRCLVPADGFYEWRTEGKKKLPQYFRMQDGRPFALAGLWEDWRDPEGAHVLSFTLITTEPNALVAKIHDRMPVILPPDQYDRWLDPGLRDPAAILPLLRPYPAEAMTSWEVSTRVNKAGEDDPSLIEPGGQRGLFG